MSNRDDVSSRDMDPLPFGLASTQVKELMIFRCDDDTVWSTAARSGSRDTFEVVVAALEKKLTSAEVMV